MPPTVTVGLRSGNSELSSPKSLLGSTIPRTPPEVLGLELTAAAAAGAGVVVVTAAGAGAGPTRPPNPIPPVNSSSDNSQGETGTGNPVGCPCVNPCGAVAPIPGSTNPAEPAACPGVASPNCLNADAGAPASMP